MSAEPELEELSAYLDQELTGTARQELEAHLQTCETCRRRLDALRETVSAVKAMPMEAPPRVFTIPPQRQQRSSVPAWGWAGGALAAACLVLAVTIGLTHLPHAAGGAASPALGLMHSGQGAANDQAARGFWSTTVSDPQNPSRTLTLGTGQATLTEQKSTTGSAVAPYAAAPANGALQVSLVLQGVPGSAAPTGLNDARVQLSLSRSGYEVILSNPESFSATRDGSAVRLMASYRLSTVGLPSPAAGTYTLRATWQGLDGSAVALVAEVPVTITQ